MRVKSDKCSKCKVALRSPNARYCKPCKATYMRGWRSTNSQSVAALKEKILALEALVKP